MRVKKSIIIAISLISLTSVAFVAYAFNDSRKVQSAYGDPIPGSHHITFTHSDFVSAEFDEDTWCTYFKVGRANAIDGKYDLYTYDDFTYSAYVEEEDFNYGGADYIVEKPVYTNAYDIYFAFSILTRASFNLSESKVVYEHYDSDTKKTTNSAIYFEEFGEEKDRTVYYATFNASGDYKCSIKFTQIDLYFSC